MPSFVACVTMLIGECTVEEMEQRPHANQSPATDPKRFNHALSQELVELGLAKTGRTACLRYRTSRTLPKRNSRLRRTVLTSFLESNPLFHGRSLPVSIRQPAGQSGLTIGTMQPVRPLETAIVPALLEIGGA